jgi:hypothetical protein
VEDQPGRVPVQLRHIRTLDGLDIEHRKDRNDRQPDSLHGDMETRTYPPSISEGFVPHRHAGVYRSLGLIEEPGWVEFGGVPPVVCWIVCKGPGRRWDPGFCPIDLAG